MDLLWKLFFLALWTTTLTRANGTAGNNPDGTAGNHPDGTAGNNPDGTAGNNPDGTAGNNPDGTAGNHPDGTAGNHPDGTAGNNPDGTAGNNPDGTAGNHPDGTAGNNPDGTAGNHPDGTAGNNPDGTAGNNPDGTTPAPSMTDQIDSTFNSSLYYTFISYCIDAYSHMTDVISNGAKTLLNCLYSEDDCKIKSESVRNKMTSIKKFFEPMDDKTFDKTYDELISFDDNQMEEFYPAAIFLCDTYLSVENMKWLYKKIHELITPLIKKLQFKSDFQSDIDGISGEYESYFDKYKENTQENKVKELAALDKKILRAG